MEHNILYKWSDEDVERLIRLRRTHDSLFSGRRNAAQHGWESSVQPFAAPRDQLQFFCHHQHLRSRHCSCQLLPHLLTTGIWLLLRLVVVILHD
ncbi:hypothetical protein MATL_G00099780 [Megalops atlanticus]|uniref:Uncharacterized protein n=1 Tax=Megalops atlanticus TaxID=7932 RepID=A0A9D3Q3F7_MEGAT|nr:hypothetical protein MATL_G00099780 [Megalops atlanticus]